MSESREPETAVHVRGVVVGVSVEDGTTKPTLRLRLTEEDSVKLMSAGAFGKIVAIVFDTTPSE